MIAPGATSPATRAGGRSDHASLVSQLVERRQVRAELELIPVDGVVALLPTVRVALWAARGRAPKAAQFCDEVVALHRDLLTVAEHVLPPPRADVIVDLFPPEPALFERVAGHDEVRLFLRAFATRARTLDTWAHALWTNLRATHAKVEPAAWR